MNFILLVTNSLSIAPYLNYVLSIVVAILEIDGDRTNDLFDHNIFIKILNIRLHIILIIQSIPVIKPIRLKSFFSIAAFERNRSYVHELKNKKKRIICLVILQHTLFHFYHLINT
jgi:hypothetical protein